MVAVKVCWKVPALDGKVARGPEVTGAVPGKQVAAEEAIYDFNWLAATGTGIFVAAILSAAWLRVGPVRTSVAVTPARLAALGDKIVETLTAWHREQPDALGPNRPALIAQLRGEAPEAALDAALSELASTGRATRQGPIWRLPKHQPRLTRADERLWERVCPLLAAEDLRPPRVR